MAIDKNSKAYQSLLKSGYTDEQITQMHSDVAGGKTTQQTVANTTPVNTPNYENQGSGNYVYNEATGYYENQSTPSTPSSTQTTQTTPTMKQETEIKQPETAVSTVPEIKQEGALKPLSQDYYNQTSEEAQNQIRDNLNRYKQTNPEYFTDYESFKKNFSYDTRDDVQKNTLDTWYGGYQKGMQLAGLPTTELYTQYKDGQVSAAELENLRIYDPNKYADLQSQINKGNIVAAYDDTTGADQATKSIQEMAYDYLAQTFNQFLSGDTSSQASQYFQEYKDNVESPEMLAISDKTTELQEEMENIQSDLDSIKKSVEEEYAGTGATRSKINAIISDRSYELQLQLRTLNSEYNKYATQYNNRLQQYQTEFSMQLQEYQLGMQERNQMMNELGFAMDMMSFETPQQAQEREWEYRVKQQEYTNGNINSKDYQTRYKAAIKSVENLLAQYPNIPMQRSAEQMAQDILKAIDEGSDLGTELTKINKMIQQKPEYKYLYNQTFNPDSPTQKASGLGKTFSLNGVDYVEYNDKIYTAEQFNSMFGGTITGTATTNGGIEYTPKNVLELQGAVVDWKNGNKTGSHGGQCGKFVNDYLQSMGLDRLYGNSVASKMKTINTDKKDLGNLAIGSVAVFDYSNTPGVSDNAKKYGHVGIVVEVDQAGQKVKLLESNLKGDERISTRWVTVNGSTLQGFFDPSKGSVTTIDSGVSTENIGNKQQTSADRLTLTALRNGQIVNSKVPETIEKLVNAGFSEDEINEALNQNMEYFLPDDQRSEKNAILNSFRSNDIVKNFQSSTEQLLGLSAAVEQANGAGDLASIYMFMRAQDPKSVVREGEFEMAAQTMGLGGQVETWFTKLANGQRLTPEQRQNFIDVTVKVLEAKKQAYKIVYDEAVQQMKAASIPSVYYPKDWATEIDGIIARLTGTSTTTTSYNIQNTNFYQKYANTASGRGSTVTLSNGQKVTW